MKNDLKNGMGRQTHKSKNEVYIGGFKDGKRHEFGRLTKNNELYIGWFMNGYKNGIGYQKLSQHDFYFGFYENGKQEGIGMLISEDKEIKA
jgi:hypothetical protein